MASAGSCRDPKELFALKQLAVKFYEENKVPERMEEILNSTFYDNPPDVYGHLVNFFSQFTKPAVLDKISSRPVFDSMGMLTIRTDVYCLVNNLSKLINSSTLPNANIRASPEDREKAELEMHESVLKAIKMMNSDLNRKISGMSPMAQDEIDTLVLEYIEEKKTQELSKKEENAQSDHHALSQTTSQPVQVDEKDKRKSTKGKASKSSASISIVPDKPLEVFATGSEVGAALSQAVCVCGAQTSNIPIYRHVGNLSRITGALHEFRIPLPMVTIIQIGKTSPGKANCVKEYMIVPGINMSPDKSIEHILQIYHHVAKSLSIKFGATAKFVTDTGALCPHFDTPNQALDLLQEAVNAQGLTIGEDMYLAINAAAHEFFDSEKGKYEVLNGQLKTPDDMVDFWADIIAKYPSIVAIIDPIRGEDKEQWTKLCERVSEQLYIIGDRFYQRPGLLQAEELPTPTLTSGIVLNLERMNTVSDIITCANKLRDVNNEIVIAANQGDTSDTFIVDLAVGLNARFFKVGGPCRGERTCKLNRLVEIFGELEPPEERKSELTEGAVTHDKEEQSLQSEMKEESEEVRESQESGPDAFGDALGSEKNGADLGLWGEDKKSTLKLHTSFVFPFIENPPPPPPVVAEGDENADGESARAASKSSKS